MFKRTDRETGFTLLELLYVMSIVAVLAGMLIPQLILQRARAIEISAQKRLQTIGSVMAKYSLSNRRGDYGTFQQLKDARLISNDVTQTSMVTDYSLALMTTKAATMGRPAAFTVIAYPRPERSSGRMSTFAITDDNVVRVYRRRPGVNPLDPRTWDPIL